MRASLAVLALLALALALVIVVVASGAGQGVDGKRATVRPALDPDVALPHPGRSPLANRRIAPGDCHIRP